MKKIICTIMMGICLVFTGCGDVKTLGGVTYDTYGFLNQSEKKNPDVRYELITGNIVWSVLLCETIIAPIYFLGFSLYEPVAEKDEIHIKGKIN